MRKYYYPSNMESKPQIWLWTIPDLAILFVLALIGFLIVIQPGHNVIMLAIAAGFGIYTMHLDFLDPTSNGTRAMSDYVKDYWNYLTGALIWQHLTWGSSKEDEKYLKPLTAKEEKDLQKKEALEMSAEEEKKKKTKNLFYIVIMFAMLGILALLLIAGQRSSSQSTAASVENSVQFEKGKTYQVEYSNNNINPLDFIKKDNGNKVTADPEEIVGSQVGDTKVTYTIKDNDGNTGKVTKTISVVDSKAPDIELNSDTITLKVGDQFDPNMNIKSVSDPVDGTLGQAESSTFNAYTVSSDVNTAVAGNYTVTIDALDNNGNESNKTYSVVVMP